jgi:hypothetical protein
MPIRAVLGRTPGRGCLVWASLLLVACASGSAAGPGSTGGSGASAEGPACPLEIPGTRVVAYEIPSGVAITFGTDAAHVDEVRESTRLLASFYNMRHDPREGPAATPPNQVGSITPGALQPLPPSQARVRDVANGAAVEFVPLREPDLQRLRDEIATRWKDDPSACPADGP